MGKVTALQKHLINLLLPTIFVSIEEDRERTNINSRSIVVESKENDFVCKNKYKKMNKSA